MALEWSSQYDYQIRAEQVTMMMIVPTALIIIFLTLYIIYGEQKGEQRMSFWRYRFALTGGVLLQWWLGPGFSVAVWVGYVAFCSGRRSNKAW